MMIIYEKQNRKWNMNANKQEKMRGVSTSHSHARLYPGRRTLKRFWNNDQADNIILIDADDEHLDNVIIIDVPDSLPKKCQGSSMHRNDRNGSVETVICIEDDESSGNRQSDINAKKGAFATGTSTSKSFVPPTNDIEDFDVEESQFVPDKVTPVRLSKCKRTYSGKVFSGNSHGLNADSESDPDCELMEDVSGKVQEKWEKASSRRKKGIMNGQPVKEDQNDTASAMDNNFLHTVRKRQIYQKKKAPFCSLTDESINKDASRYPPRTKKNAYDNHTYTSTGVSYSRGKHSSSIYDGHADHQHFEPGCSSSYNENRWRHPAVPNSSRHEPSMKEVGSTSVFESVEESPILEPCRSKTRCGSDGNFYHGKVSSLVDDATIRRCEIPVEGEVDLANDFLSNKLKKFQETASDSVEEKAHLESCEALASGGVKNMLNLRYSFISSTLSDKPRDCNLSSISAADGSVHRESFCFKSSSLVSGDVMEKGCHMKNRLAVDEIPCNKIHINEAKLGVDEFLSEKEREDKDDHLHTENGQVRNSIENCVINEREMIKETDEYKRAMEEEWASRQQVLQIQAEEARRLIRLQKRKKAESIRLLGMERRQKERVEEIRNTQKKDEENMNLKEVLRVEVRKELEKLVATCYDMASLLHSFGIQVDGWPYPSQQEVQTAYKRALRAFHPDRASQSELRHQVEAEEKFKLMNRLKEKFALSL